MANIQRPILDEKDGENLAVRAFLIYYGGGANPTAQQMAQHMRRSGFDIVPEWVEASPGHLTKGGAQDWLRRLFAEEPSPNRVMEIVQSVRFTARHGMLSLVEPAKAKGDVDPELAVCILRTSYPWRLAVPGWFDYRDYVVANWPKDAESPHLELHGLLEKHCPREEPKDEKGSYAYWAGVVAERPQVAVEDLVSLDQESRAVVAAWNALPEELRKDPRLQGILQALTTGDQR